MPEPESAGEPDLTAPLVAQKTGKPLNRRLVEKMCHAWGARATVGH
jgi:hypothetical protein